MKKIIKPGNKPPKTLECWHCWCVFESDEYTENKLVWRSELLLEDKCPDCKRRVKQTEEL